MSNCPECYAQFQVVTSVVVGEIIVCPECQSQLEVLSLDPVELALPPEIEEDWGE
jgi:alpha-aminoadipate carrier protein LysW